MKKKTAIVWLSLMTLILTAIAVLMLLPTEPQIKNVDPADSTAPERLSSKRIKNTQTQVDNVLGPSQDSTESPSEVEPQEDAAQTAEERKEAEDEAKVDAFDNLTDKWMEPATSGVTMKDVDEFARAFRSVPKERQDECVHRALNLVPDENVMLLAGILMDKTMDKEIVETVFNDILNRDEAVKKPIMQQIYKDKSHPCWADVAWIFDVTGEKKE